MDFILTWVNDADPQWQRERTSYLGIQSGDANDARFRDWGTLHYLFRGIERFAPWVDKIHFITCGQIPRWLNTSHPKLHIANHESFIPKQYLPTFNSRTIELNFHHIESLSEKYVYFNDDTFLIEPINPDFFFKKGLPCDEAAMKVLTGGRFQHTLLANVGLLKSHQCNKFRAIRRAPWKWYHPRYGIYSINNIMLTCISRHYPGFVNFHLPQPSRKSTLRHLWEISYNELNDSCRNKFRKYETVNPYVQRYWELSTNSFYPVGMQRRGKCFELREDSVTEAADFIQLQKLPLICVNDHENVSNFNEASRIIRLAFEKILPTPSTFERT